MNNHTIIMGVIQYVTNVLINLFTTLEAMFIISVLYAYTVEMVTEPFHIIRYDM